MTFDPSAQSQAVIRPVELSQVNEYQAVFGIKNDVVQFETITVTVTVICRVDSLTALGTISDEKYILSPTAKSINLVSFTQIPNCQYPLSY